MLALVPMLATKEYNRHVLTVASIIGNVMLLKPLLSDFDELMLNCRFSTVVNSKLTIYIYLQRASLNALTKYTIKSQVYVNTTTFIWSIKTIHFDLLTGHISGSQSNKSKMVFR